MMLEMAVREYESCVLPNEAVSSVFDNFSFVSKQLAESVLYHTLAQNLKSIHRSSCFIDAGTVLDSILPVWFSETGTSGIVSIARAIRDPIVMLGHLPPKRRYKIKLTIRNVKKGQPHPLDYDDLF